jgi:hypothetical protein
MTKRKITERKLKSVTACLARTGALGIALAGAACAGELGGS